MKLSDQFDAIHAGLPDDWESVRLTIATEQPAELARAAQVLAPMGAGRAGDTLTLTVSRAGGPAGPEAARRLFSRLDAERVWCELSAGTVAESAHEDEAAPAGAGASVTASWDAALSTLPPDWSDLLGVIEIDSSALLPRAALLCAPLNPTRDHAKVAFTFRSARAAGYGASPGMVRRCFERLDEEGITGRARILRVLSDTGLVATQGPVWLVDGRML